MGLWDSLSSIGSNIWLDSAKDIGTNLATNAIGSAITGDKTGTKTTGGDDLWGNIFTAGLQTTGSLIFGLLEQDANEAQQAKNEALAREQLEWERQQAELNRQDALAAKKLAVQMAAIEMRAKAAQVDPGLEGFTRQADRLMQGSQIDQNALNSIISSYNKFGG